MMDHVTNPGSHLTTEGVEFLRRHSGVRPASPSELAVLAERTAALDARELRFSLPLPAVAGLLSVSELDVLGMTESGEMYVHDLADGHHRWPDWQLDGGHLLPHLRGVVGAIPAGAFPTQVRALMVTPDAAFLDADDEPMAPRDWLLAGGAPELVVELARVLGEQI